ncbi:MAG: RICIN domain-containing protein [Prevotella sp.]|nr:RICIN domain-containing protein [Prevotella sp.]
MTSSKQLFIMGLCLFSVTASAQQPRPSSTLFLQPQAAANVTIPFSFSAPGKQLPIRWGLDVAWLNEQNMHKGINFIGRENLSMARSSFQMNVALAGDTALTTSQTTMLANRTRVINFISPTVDIVLNADQGDGSATYINTYYSSNNIANPDRWARLIDASVAWMQKNYPAHNIVAVSPFNEPDYVYWNEGTLANFKEIAQLLKEDYPRFKDIAITAGNTLNNDNALTWYNGVKPYATWGNTHQLAGSFANFANFWQQVAADGNYPYADELHNVGEAMIAANYGMKAGIWWGFDSRARGEFCRISNHGSQIAYAENRSAWSAASVYRDDENGTLKAFVGGSERQASTSSYLFLSPDRDVFFDGQGPLRAFRMEYPGGTGYSQGQTNAERVYDITSGADVERQPVGTAQYKIMNKATKGLVSVYSGSNIAQNWYTATTQPKDADLWDVAPVSDRIGGDFSFYTFTNPSTGLHMNILNNSTDAGANVIAYNANNASNEQWYMEYAGDGFYFIRNRETSRYLTLRNNLPRSGINIVQDSLLNTTDRDRQLWRLLPAAAPTETDAPDAPTALTATGHSASIQLAWSPSIASDIASYTVLRANADGTNWNTIARGITANTYTDNTCRQGQSYLYKVMAVDQSLNASAPTEAASATTIADKTLIASWQMEGNLEDETINMMDAASLTATTYQSDSKVGDSAVIMTGTNWLQLPYKVADMDEMTVALWVKWTNSTRTWTRIFDFGNGTNQYLFLTPSNGGNMRFAIKNGGAEQTVDAATKLSANLWHHVAVTIGSGTVTIYVDGQSVGSSTGITIKPSDIRPVLNYLGRSQYNADPMFAGALDDVRIYNYPLSQTEIQGLMAEPTGIQKIVSDRDDSNHTAYGIDGKTASTNYRGLIIENGKKTIKR